MSGEGEPGQPTGFDAHLPWPNRDDAGIAAAVRRGSAEGATEALEPLDEVDALPETPPSAVPSGPPPTSALVYRPELQQVIDRRLTELDELANTLQKDFQRIALQQLEEIQTLMVRSEQELQDFARRRVIDVERVSEAAMTRLDALTAERGTEFQLRVDEALAELRQTTERRLIEFERVSDDRLGLRERQAVLAVEQAEQQAVDDIENAGSPVWAKRGVVVAVVTACASLGLAILSLVIGH